MIITYDTLFQDKASGFCEVSSTQLKNNTNTPIIENWKYISIIPINEIISYTYDESLRIRLVRRKLKYDQTR